MRPHDIIVLLKIILLEGRNWQYRDLSASLYISISEISQSLMRSSVSGLYDSHLKKIKRNALMEFIQYGLPYVFPQRPGPMATGLATAHSHPFYKVQIMSNEIFVWPDIEGNTRGQTIAPLHKEVPKAVRHDEVLYKVLASIDILRVGKVRERNLVVNELKKYIL